MSAWTLAVRAALRLDGCDEPVRDGEGCVLVGAGRLEVVRHAHGYSLRRHGVSPGARRALRRAGLRDGWHPVDVYPGLTWPTAPTPRSPLPR